jgi:hypothetical protein
MMTVDERLSFTTEMLKGYTNEKDKLYDLALSDYTNAYIIAHKAEDMQEEEAMERIAYCESMLGVEAEI